MSDYLFVGDLPLFQEKLLSWFKKQNRPLPWRMTYNPYHVWISEIMLQQTQMERGVAYFNRWIARFPEVRDVAEADIQEILKMWEGLGYYARARNLHKAAGQIVDRFAGVVPCDIDQLLSLPGIGPYTAAAIGSVACNIDIPVVDANVARIFARLFDIESAVKEKKTKDQIDLLALSLLPLRKARYWNQALMDLGGLVCTPKTPRCTVCPLATDCKSLQAGTVELRPLVVRKKNIEHLERVAVVLVKEGKTRIESCEREGLWQGLWELSTIDLMKNESAEQGCSRLLENLGLEEISGEPLTMVKHSYTRFRVQLHAFVVHLPAALSDDGNDDSRWCTWTELQEYGFPAGTRKIFEYMAEERPDFVEGLMVEGTC